VSPTRVALVAGGGTAGHVQPALAVAREIEARMGEGSVELVGSRRGLERAILADTGLPVSLLPGRGIARRLSPRAVVDNVVALAGLAMAACMALGLVVRRRPRVVVAVGGYASVPVALAAALARVPVVLVNVDAVPGAANRLVARFARASAVAWPGTDLARAVVTGAPVRPAVAALARARGRARGRALGQAQGGRGDGVGGGKAASPRATLGLPDGRTVVAAVGGSLGARRLNEAVLSLAGTWAERGDLALYHVVGRRDAEWAAAESPVPADGSGGAHVLWYRQVPYESRLEQVLAAADVLVSRAGGMTVAEIAVVGTPALLVPLPGAPGDHQRANARVLVDSGAAVLVDDEDCTGRRLAAELAALLDAPGRLDAMADAAAALGRPDAAAAVAELVLHHARATRPVHAVEGTP